MVIISFLQKPRERLGQGQNVGCLQTGMLKQGCNITYLNNTQENWERGGHGEKRIKAQGAQGDKEKD